MTEQVVGRRHMDQIKIKLNKIYCQDVIYVDAQKHYRNWHGKQTFRAYI